jgi:accessory secretory protein Asp2
MAELKIGSKDVILGGYSMGSYPAMYYAADIQPGAVIAAKPIVNLGSFSEKMDFPHHFNTDWPLDMRHYLVGRMDKADTEPLNNKFWKRFKQADWSKIDVSLFTLDMDEYDGESLPQLLAAFRDERAKVAHYYEHGYHIDKTDEMISWVEGRIKALKAEKWLLIAKPVLEGE